MILAASALGFLGCGGKAESKGSKTSDTNDSKTSTTRTAPAAENGPFRATRSTLRVDKVSGANGHIQPDGSPDGALDISFDGPVKSIVLMTVDETGKPVDGQQWDTVVGDSMPAGYESSFQSGGETWQLGVYEANQLVNADDGTVTLPDGHHSLTLYATDTGHFTGESHLRVMIERPNGKIDKSNIFTF